MKVQCRYERYFCRATSAITRKSAPFVRGPLLTTALLVLAHLLPQPLAAQPSRDAGPWLAYNLDSGKRDNLSAQP